MCKADSCRPFCMCGRCGAADDVRNGDDGGGAMGRRDGAMPEKRWRCDGCDTRLCNLHISEFGVSNYWNLMRCTRETSDLD